ncbi:MAG: hypothetical protein ACLR0M_14525 [[Clostridium] symbiosum]
MMMKEDKKMNSIKNKMIAIFGGLNLLFWDINWDCAGTNTWRCDKFISNID